MRRNRLLLLLGLSVAGAILVVLRLPTPRSPIAEPRSPRPVVVSRKPPLQADAEGYYAPGYPFTLNGLRFTGFSLRSEALVSVVHTDVACIDADISVRDLEVSRYDQTP